MPEEPPEERGTYDDTKIGIPGPDAMRHALGDMGTLKDENEAQIWLRSDKELRALLGTDEALWAKRMPMAIATVADSLVREKSQSPDVYRDEQGVSLEWKSRIKAWRDLAERQRALVAKAENQPIGPTFRVGEMSGPDLTLFR